MNQQTYPFAIVIRCVGAIVRARRVGQTALLVAGYPPDRSEQEGGMSFPKKGKSFPKRGDPNSSNDDGGSLNATINFALEIAAALENLTGQLGGLDPPM